MDALKAESDTQLHLASIACRGRTAKCSTRCCSGSPYVVREQVICAVQDIESLGERFDGQAFPEPKLFANPHVKRCGIEAPSSVAADTDWTVVVVRVPIAIGACLNVERQRRRVCKQVAEHN